MLWAKLCAAYPRQDTTGATAEVYFEHLSVYPENQVTDAISGVIGSSKWFPAVAEIIAEIKGEHRCQHTLTQAVLRMERAELKSREAVLVQNEKYQDERMERVNRRIAELEGRSVELYRADKLRIEESGLPEAQRRLDALNGQIQAAERTITILKQKIKLFDQARILQADQ